jgi:Cu-Zn family superoxide dismutase
MNSIFKPFKTLVLALSACLLTLLWGCPSDRASTTANSATAIVYDTSNPSEVLGEANFTPTEDGLEIAVTVEGVSPGEHGFHIHAVGSCENGGEAAEGHFNPDNVEHGYLPEDGFENAHAGDLGNITVGADGTGTLNLTIPGLSLDQGESPINGQSVILHEKKDDLTTQPTGDAGGRIGCGIITPAAT